MKPRIVFRSGSALLGPAVLLLAGTLMAGAGKVGAAESGDQPAEAPVLAKWAPRKLHFVFMGFTAHYSCDGLLDRMKDILLQLGARDDLMLTRSGCVRLEGPEPFPGVDATFSVLEPVGGSGEGAQGNGSSSQGSGGQGNGGSPGTRGGGQSSSGGSQGGRGQGNGRATAGTQAGSDQPVQARWESVRLDSDTPNHSGAGECELIEQVKKSVLPLFTTRDLTYSSDCFPHTESLSGTRLSVQVPRAIKSPPAASTSH